MMSNRNELLREMYMLVRDGGSVGSVLHLDEHEDDDGLDAFLERFNLQKKYAGYFSVIPMMSNDSVRQSDHRFYPESGIALLSSLPTPSAARNRW